jgi:hypothetical protein
MTSIEPSYEDGIADEKARIIELIRAFEVADMESLETPKKLIKFPLEDLIALIDGE